MSEEMTNQEESTQQSNISRVEEIINSLQNEAQILTEAPEESKRPKKFNETYLEMGLTLIRPGVYTYSDMFGQVFYKETKTIDNDEIPYLGMYTRRLPRLEEESGEPKYICIVSNSYQFTGNQVLNDKIREMVSEIRTPIFRENTLISSSLDSMYHEMIIQNSTNIPQVGDVYPEVIITNSYNGKRAITISFGFVILDGQQNKTLAFGFRTKLSSIKQVHLTSARSSLSAAVGNYVDVFSQNALSLIETNFNTTITDEDLLKVMDLVEKAGKRKRAELSTHLANVTTENQALSSWALFNAICKFSTIEKNINTKLLLEDIAERVLVIPAQISEALVVLNERSENNE